MESFSQLQSLNWQLTVSVMKTYSKRVPLVLFTEQNCLMVKYNFSSLSLQKWETSNVTHWCFSLKQLAAVRNIPMSSLSLHEEEKFTELLQTASKLRHPNIVTLLGFCIDNGKHLLVYEYAGNLSLYNAMHDDVYKPLSWGFRLHIAIGVARALE